MKKILVILFLLSFYISNSQSSDSDKKYIESLINKASAFFQNSDYENSLKYSQKALLKSFEINDDYLIAHSYNSIGAVYNEFSNSKRAIGFYQKALSHANNTDDANLKSWIYGNLGSVYYYNLNDAKKGIQYYKDALVYAEKINDSSQINYTNLSIVAAYFSVNDFKNGMIYMNKAKYFTLKNAADDAKISYFDLLGIYNSNYNQSKIAEQYFSKSEDLAIKPENQSHLINVYENLAIHYKKHSNLAKFEFYNKKAKILSNALFSEEKQIKLDSSAVQIELNVNKIQLEKMELAYEIQKQKNKNFIIINILSAVIFIVLLGLIFSLFKNIKDRKKLNNELLVSNNALKIAKENAEEASLLKTQFVSTISHELRTPLYGVVGITNMLLDEHKELANSPHLSSLKFSARYLLSLVNDILQINKIEENRIVLENLTFNIPDEINMVKNALIFIAEKNKNTITVNIDKNIPEFLIGDKLRLAQILMNLVSNALKFTKNGEIIISVNLLKVENKSHILQFKVSDNGIGIADVDQEKIFDKFVQVGRKDDDYQGTGLGLSIVKKLLSLFNSTINLESKLGVGTTFTFDIAFDYDPKKTLEIINNIQVDLTSSQLFNVLVVEDNKINQVVTRKFLEKNSYTCTLADDGYQAIEILSKDHFDIILMDINMPLINGFDTTRKIRKLGYLTPIIALTAFAKDEITEEAISAGMNDIIVKPFEPAKLFQIILNQINKTKNAG